MPPAAAMRQLSGIAQTRRRHCRTRQPWKYNCERPSFRSSGPLTMHAFIALRLLACLDPSNHGTCFSLLIADSTQEQPDGSQVIMTGCMETEEMNSTKRDSQEHQDIRNVYHSGGWSCQIASKQAPDRSHA
jgi:hypothetical protein